MCRLLPVLLFLIVSGRLRGGTANWAWCLLAFLLVVDLARANSPWIRYENYLKKYATNEVLDILKDRPYERRVVLAPFQINGVLHALAKGGLVRQLSNPTLITEDNELVLVDLTTCVVNTEVGIQQFNQSMREDSHFITRLERNIKKKQKAERRAASKN